MYCIILQIVPGFRVGIVLVLGTMPVMFGMAAASPIVCHFHPKLSNNHNCNARRCRHCQNAMTMQNALLP